MKTLLAAIATAAFAAGAAADSFYHGFGKDNPDLEAYQATTNSVVGVQPGVGDSLKWHPGFEAGKDNLFGTPRDRGDQSSSKYPNIYGAFGEP
jgi:hypothetical protein